MGFFTEQESGAAAVTGGADGSSELWKYSPAAGQGKNTGKKKRQSHREVWHPTQSVCVSVKWQSVQKVPWKRLGAAKHNNFSHKRNNSTHTLSFPAMKVTLHFWNPELQSYQREEVEDEGEQQDKNNHSFDCVTEDLHLLLFTTKSGIWGTMASNVETST